MQTASESTVTVTPDSLANELEPAADLTQAVERLAARLAIEPEAIRVRIQFRGCETCEIRMPPKQPYDLSLDEALAELQPSDKLWLVVNGLTCYYYYDGNTVSPLACQNE